jgi:hypothetical protein
MIWDNINLLNTSGNIIVKRGIYINVLEIHTLILITKRYRKYLPKMAKKYL